MGVLTRDLLEVVHYVKRAAPNQGGIIDGANPSAWNPTDPFPLWVIQVFIIICFTQLLALLFARIRQPRVIAEVIGGIILGPTVMGRIPGFTNSIFPGQSISVLMLTATIGLVFFLFLIGLEIDVRLIRRNAKSAMTISAVGMVLPFALGIGLAVALYHQFADHTVNFGHFLLFVGVAVAITAFPVLCRILTDLNLLEDHVGVVVLSAGIGNDVVGWILLALAVALTNASSGLTALWILLTGSAFVLFMLYPVRWAFVWLAKHTGSLENGSPTPFMMTVTLLVIMTAAFFTDIIGIHPIFGGFVAGLIVPHEGGFAIALVEKLEDLVSIVFLPLYFTLSGLRTNLGLLNTGLTWGYIILICTIAFLGKFIGCAVTARLAGFSFRESGAIGTLMSCKGLVELIVLNIGLQAKILNTRLFSMFVVHAVILTVMTTPLTLWWYPPKYRTGGGRKRARGLERGATAAATGQQEEPQGVLEGTFKTKFAVVLNRIEHLPAIMTITQLLQPPWKESVAAARAVTAGSRAPSRGSMSTEKDEKGELSPQAAELVPSSAAAGARGVSIDALRLIELTDRTSAMMRSSEADDLLPRDPLVSVFTTFGRLNRIPVAAAFTIVPQDAFPGSVAAHARDTGAQLVVVPWHAAAATPAEEPLLHTPAAAGTYNPFDSVFGGGGPSQERTASVVYATFVRRVFAECPADVALFVDRGGEGPSDPHVFLPFFGGPDDRLALKFVVQLCANPNVNATVVRMRKTSSSATLPAAHGDGADAEAANALTVQSVNGMPDTVYGAANTETRMASDTADNILWSRFTTSTDANANTGTVGAALSRVAFSEMSSATPLRAVIRCAAAKAQSAGAAGRSLLLVVGRARRLAVESHHAELKDIISEQQQQGQHHAPLGGDVTRTLGDVAAGFMAAATSASGVLIMQAAAAPSSSSFT